MIFFNTLFLVLVVGGCAGQSVFLERPASQIVELGSPARLNCTVNDTLGTSAEWWFGGSVLAAVAGRIQVQPDYLRLPSLQWDQIGEYSCVVRVGGNSFAAPATVNITGYVKPFVDAEEGVITVSHVLGEEQKLECPIAGTPGPTTFYWESLDSGQTVTSNTSVESGVFVDGEGKLDVSRVQTATTELFACVGEDPVGNFARTRIRVIAVEEPEQDEERIDLLEWYFILAYSIGGVLLLLGLTVLVVVCWLHRDQCCDKVTEKRGTRLRVRRSKVALGDIKV